MSEVMIFASKALIIFLVFAALVVLIAVLSAKAQAKPELEVKALHKRLKEVEALLKSLVFNKKEKKEEHKKQKAELKKLKKNTEPTKTVFLINFKGDLKASQVEDLREEVSAVLQVAKPQDEVVVKIESPGGVVHGYGLAASQLMRIREKGIQLTACVDTVAASGGYMMACVANQILVAPFAIIGSIGVLAQIPNLNRLLKKHDVDFREYTAGEYKRTVSFLGEITPKGEQHFVEKLGNTHELFKKHVKQFRPHVDLPLVATGDYWFGQEALSLGLADKVTTSDDYLLSLGKEFPLYEIKYHKKETLSDKLSGALGKSFIIAGSKFLEKLEKKPLL